jgi:hypothetical protein
MDDINQTRVVLRNVILKAKYGPFVCLENVKHVNNSMEMKYRKTIKAV